MRIFKFDTIDSTNKFLKNLKDREEYDLVIAKTQSAGRGRRGNVWLSEEGAGLFSFMLKEDKEISMDEYAKLPIVIGYSILKAMEKISGLKMLFKWTNDVYLNGKKLSGILVEKDGDNFIIGIGININNTEFFELNDFATSLKKETGNDYSIDEVIFKVIEEFKIQYERFVNKEWDIILKEINTVNYLFGKRVKIVGIKEELEGIAGDILESGKLEIYIGQETREFNIGEIHICK
ncbi:MAG: biotin--[acetyl-CoA-carboxylase] ligase [Cetobacterium sp.]|uniref:biotin--[acetyl-CoA-carboxylase] ligase n=1 Tax=unclassified Cetobacterium TaxID=2630983 RepID=UPI00163C2E32|nr:biotin--[acetyl-CoA-carboxylase] ligase [Cetobacterium sp. 2A]MBC2856406.1 biotin--[acetyl-CoA-carboxylase] ligase [Cetobacterium sp. 2A]